MDLQNINDIEEQNRIEIKTDLNNNIFVEAGAGAGKTSILVSRIMNQLKSGDWTADQIVAITFTNKAAQELKERIGFGLRDEFHKANGDTKEYLGNALRNLDRMQISTIHSFCFKLLMEKVFNAGLRMDMMLLDDEAAREKKHLCFYEWYKLLSYAEIRRFKENFIGKNSEAVLESAFNLICEIDENVVIEYDKDLLKNGLDYYKNIFRQRRLKYEAVILDELEKETNKKYQSLLEVASTGLVYKDFAKLLETNGNDREFVLKTYNEEVKAIKACKVAGINKNAATEINEAAREEAYRGFDVEALVDELSAHQNALVIELAVKCRNAYRQCFDNQEITNDMLLAKARDLVVNDADARAAFAKKYRTIYVDEFQDTDHVQTELLFALCSDENGKLRPGSIFVVGDPKQSIYRFRGADLPLYYETRDKMKNMPGCKFYSLNYNFRSNEELVKFVNKNNKDLLDGYEEMVSRAVQSDDNVPRKSLTGVYHLGSPTEKESNYKKQDDVASLVDVITKLVNNKVCIWDKIKNKYRPVEYKDFLVLCYSTYDMESYMAALLAEGIPVQISGAVDFLASSELRRFKTLYDYLAFPHYKRIREAAGQCIIRGIINADNKEFVAEKLGKLLTDTKDFDGAGCALYLVKHLEYLLDYDKEVEANALIRLQAQLQQMVEAVMLEYPNNRQEMARAFSTYLEEKVDRELTLKEDSNTVRFMNVHKAKGLEGNIVVICKRNEKHEYKESSYQEKASDGLHHLYPSVVEQYGNFGSKVYSAYANKPVIKEKSKMAEMNEYHRLDYVEVTRAIEAIIFLNSMGKDTGCMEYSFDDAKYLYGEFAEMFDDAQDEDIKTETTILDYDDSRCDVIIEQGQANQQYWKLSPSDLEVSVFVAGKNSNIGSEDKVDERPRGHLFGTAMHRSYELMILRLRNGENDLATQKWVAYQAVSEIMEDLQEIYDYDAENIAKSYLVYLKTLLAKFVADKKILDIIASNAEIYTEFPFSLYISKKDNAEVFKALKEKLPDGKLEKLLPLDDNQKVWVNGKADIVVVYPDGSILVMDYKSDWAEESAKDVFAEIIKKRYGGQMELYRQMLAIIFKVDIRQIKGEFYLTE